MLEFLQRVGEHVGAWLYVIAGGLAFAEAAVLVGMVLPGEVALLVAGFGAHQGWLLLWPMVGIAVGAAALGDSVGYEVGRVLGPTLRGSRLGRWVGEDRWRRGDAFLHRHGGRAVLLGRFTAVLRALTPGMAGMAHMPYLRTFLPWNVVGAVVWGAGCVLLGYGFSAKQTWSVSSASPSGLAYANGALFMAALRGERLWRIVLNGENVSSVSSHYNGTYGRLRAVVKVPGENAIWFGTTNADNNGDGGAGSDRFYRSNLS